MKPVPHPGCSRRFGAPANWRPDVDGEIMSLEIADVSGVGGRKFMESLWRPSAEDLEALNHGASIVLGIEGTIHPVIYVGASTPPKHDLAKG